MSDKSTRIKPLSGLGLLPSEVRDARALECVKPSPELKTKRRYAFITRMTTRMIVYSRSNTPNAICRQKDPEWSKIVYYHHLPTPDGFRIRCSELNGFFEMAIELQGR